MAHDRRPPEGYVESFSPNVVRKAGRIQVLERKEKLTDDYIIRMEKFWRQKIESNTAGL
jgi:hypothetical protein